jgi:hypothetical protein
MFLDEPLRDVDIQFMTGANTSIDLIYNHEQKAIQIHEKWIDFEKSHTQVYGDAFSMRQPRSADSDLFSCDYIVEDLFELTLAAARDALSISPIDCGIWRRDARQLVQRMPRMVRVVSQGMAPGQLKVTWTGNESASVSKVYAKDIRYFIVLHKKNTCFSKRQEAILNSTGKCTPELNMSPPLTTVEC